MRCFTLTILSFFLAPYSFFRPFFYFYYLLIAHAGGMKMNVWTSLWSVCFSMELGFWFSRLASIRAYIKYRTVSLIVPFYHSYLTTIVILIQIQCNRTRALTHRRTFSPCLLIQFPLRRWRAAAIHPVVETCFHCFVLPCFV